jgi:PAS domain-containing protein
LVALALAFDVGAVTARLAAGPRFDELLIFAAVCAAVLLAVRLLVRNRITPEPAGQPASEPLKELFDSAGPMVATIGLDGGLTYVNPSAERLLGYHASDLMNEWSTMEILAPGEGARLVSEMERLCGVQRPPQPTPAGRMAAYLDCVRTLPPSQVPSFDAQ